MSSVHKTSRCAGGLGGLHPRKASKANHIALGATLHTTPTADYAAMTGGSPAFELPVS
jgi:hypothetical protein